LPTDREAPDREKPAVFDAPISLDEKRQELVANPTRS
jgi:hypothetical protein